MVGNSRIEIISVDIDDIIQSTTTRVQVVVAKTGKLLWLPVDHVDFLPGRVIVPAWLAKKLQNGIKADL